jgi:phospholipid/cholesterol/gamma-HCH transport system substrate-binding protein
MIRLRHADEWVGLLVVVTVLAFLGFILQAGVLRDWFRTVSTLRIVLPEAGVGGLSVGADVEVLGTHAGVVRRIVINPNQQMYAEAEIDDQAQAFIRRDSEAVIRRRFGVAGAAYVDISRGSGEPLDWKYAVVQAVTERAPTENIGAMVDQVREKVFPILDDAGRAAHSLAELMDRVQKGEGNVGHLLTDDSLAHQLDDTVGAAHDAVANLGQIISQFQAVLRNVNELTVAMNARDGGVPALLHRTDDTLATLQGAMRDLARATQGTPQIVHNLEGGTENLPALVTQLQQTAHQLELLLAQLRGSWLLGGSGPAPNPAAPLPSTEIRP